MDTSNSNLRGSIPFQQVPGLSFDQYHRTPQTYIAWSFRNNYGADVHLSPSATLDLISNKRESDVWFFANELRLVVVMSFSSKQCGAGE